MHMAKSRSNPRTAGMTTVGRRKMNRSVTVRGLGSENSTVKYRTSGTIVNTTTSNMYNRHFIPGYIYAEIYANAGTNIVANYQEAKFVPGTVARWVPTVGTTTSGRINIAFITNPESMLAYDNLSTDATRLAFIQGVGNYDSYPIWQEFTVSVPTYLRHRMYSTNVTADLTSVVSLDRACQVYMIALVTGAPTATVVGQFDFTDNVAMQGLSAAGFT